ncbi:hypothetical protein CDT99_11585 [Cronobacter sakazakii]|nr:hypothetical protein CDT99_11585 [Cronobacter sakazakii]
MGSGQLKRCDVMRNVIAYKKQSGLLLKYSNATQRQMTGVLPSFYPRQIAGIKKPTVMGWFFLGFFGRHERI